MFTLNKNVIVFCDFDGTLVQKDSLDLLFEKYVSANDVEHYESLLGEGKIGSKECLTALFSKIKNLEHELVLNIADSLDLTNGVSEFVMNV